MDEFNPYHLWLGLPKNVVRPDFYQLLGLDSERGFSNQQATDAAQHANQRVRKHSLGPHGQHAERLLNEIARAEAVLTNAALRKKYDAKLADPIRNKLRAAKRLPDSNDSLAPIDRMSIPLAQQESSDAHPERTLFRTAGNNDTREESQQAFFHKVFGAAIVAAAILLILVGAFLFWFNFNNHRQPNLQSISAIESAPAEVPTTPTPVPVAIDSEAIKEENSTSVDGPPGSVEPIVGQNPNDIGAVADRASFGNEPDDIGTTTIHNVPAGQVALAYFEKEETLSDNAGSVFALALSPDRSRIATGGRFGEVRIRDTKSWEVLHTIDEAPNMVVDMCFSRDGTKLVFTGDRLRESASSSTWSAEIYVVDVETGLLDQKVDLGGARPTRLTLDDDNQLIHASGETGELFRFNYLTGTELPANPTGVDADERFGGICSTKDGTLFAGTSPVGRLVTTSLEATPHATHLVKLPGGVSRLRFGRNESEILVSMTNGVCVFDNLGNRLIRTWKMPGVGGVEDFVYWPERNIYLTATRSGWLFAWHLDHDRPVGAAKFGDGGIFAVVILDADRVALCHQRENEQITVAKVEFKNQRIQEVASWDKRLANETDSLAVGIARLERGDKTRTPKETELKTFHYGTVQPQVPVVLYEHPEMYIVGRRFRMQMVSDGGRIFYDDKAVWQNTKGRIDGEYFTQVSGKGDQEIRVVAKDDLIGYTVYSNASRSDMEKFGYRRYYGLTRLTKYIPKGFFNFRRSIDAGRSANLPKPTEIGCILKIREEPTQLSPPPTFRFETADLIIEGNSFEIGRLKNGSLAYKNRNSEWRMAENHTFSGWFYTRFHGDNLQHLQVTAKQDTTIYMMKNRYNEQTPGWNKFSATRIHLANESGSLETTVFFRRRTIKKNETVVLKQSDWIGEMLLLSDDHKEPDQKQRKWIASLKSKKWHLEPHRESPQSESQSDWSVVEFENYDELFYTELDGRRDRVRWKLMGEQLHVMPPQNNANHYWVVSAHGKKNIQISKFDGNDVLIWSAISSN